MSGIVAVSAADPANPAAPLKRTGTDIHLSVPVFDIAGRAKPNASLDRESRMILDSAVPAPPLRCDQRLILWNWTVSAGLNV